MRNAHCASLLVPYGNHPEDELGLTEVGHSKLLPDGPLRQLDPVEGVGDDQNEYGAKGNGG
jgi:hypothetical protein